MIGKLKHVKFHQPIRLNAKQFSNINFTNPIEAKEYEVEFINGLLVVRSSSTSDRAFVGLANIAYMVGEELGAPSTPKPESNTTLENVANDNENVEVSFADLDANQAKKVITATDDLDDLAQFLKDEEAGKNRKSVVDALVKKLEA